MVTVGHTQGIGLNINLITIINLNLNLNLIIIIIIIVIITFPLTKIICSQQCLVCLWNLYMRLYMRMLWKLSLNPFSHFTIGRRLCILYIVYSEDVDWKKWKWRGCGQIQGGCISSFRFLRKSHGCLFVLFCFVCLTDKGWWYPSKHGQEEDAQNRGEGGCISGLV